MVLLPYIVGTGPTEYSAIAFLTFKATVGFGSVVFAGSFLLRRIFNFVAETRSTETFVALCLLVSVGMGAIAKELGLTDTAGAFVAGVLLANTNYRAQIQADILPFKGILLGIFFMDAGSSFDSELVLNELPTIITGVISLILLKAITIFTSTKVPRWMEPNRLPEVDAVRLSLLLAGGGEFAFVVLALAEKLEVLPADLGGLLTAVVLITMGVTPLLGATAENLTKGDENDYIDEVSAEVLRDLSFVEDNYPVVTPIAENAVIICGYQEMGKLLLKELTDGYKKSPHDFYNSNDTENAPFLPQIVAFDSDPSITDIPWNKTEPSFVSFGDGGNPRVLQSSGVIDPRAIYISFEEFEEILSATSRLRAGFPDAPIYARSSNRAQAQVLMNAGATDIVIESEEFPQSALLLMQGGKKLNFFSVSSVEEIRRSASIAAGITMKEVDALFEMFACLDLNEKGLLEEKVILKMVNNSNSGIKSDSEIKMMKKWIEDNKLYPMDSISFCKFYSKAPQQLRDVLEGTYVV